MEGITEIDKTEYIDCILGHLGQKGQKEMRSEQDAKNEKAVRCSQKCPVCPG